MNILITGGTGFIGSNLCSTLNQLGHNITILSREPNSVSDRIRSFKQIPKDEKFDAIINLAGEPIANKNWSDQQKQQILTSRLSVTQQIIRHLKDGKYKPEVIISASAIGYYGIQESDLDIDESFSGDDSFSSEICQQWEALAMQAELFGVRTCILRIGIVLDPEAGALKKMLLPFKFGLGGKIGHGKQWMSWIHIEDLTNIFSFVLNNKSLSGPLNATAPYPVSNYQFTKSLGRSLKRPTILPLPTFIVKLLFGQMGQELLLSGKKVIPKAILQAGFKFEHEKLDSALAHLFSR